MSSSKLPHKPRTRQKTREKPSPSPDKTSSHLRSSSVKRDPPNLSNQGSRRTVKSNADAISKETKQQRHRTSPSQLHYLIEMFNVDCNPPRYTLDDLAKRIEMPMQCVYTWFKNRRARIHRYTSTSPIPQTLQLRPKLPTLPPSPSTTDQKRRNESETNCTVNMNRKVVAVKNIGNGVIVDGKPDVTKMSIPLVLPLYPYSSRTRKPLKPSNKISASIDPHLDAAPPTPKHSPLPLRPSPPSSETRDVGEASYNVKPDTNIKLSGGSIVSAHTQLENRRTKTKEEDKTPENINDNGWKPKVGELVNVLVDDSWVRGKVEFMSPRKGYRVTEHDTWSALWVRHDQLRKLDQ